MDVVYKRRIILIEIYLLMIFICYKLFNIDVLSIIASICNLIFGTLFLISDKFYNWITIEPNKQRRIMIIIAAYLSVFPLIL
ncbi:hypothetical protein [Clostridium lundense]|uniref:hypothetical protein n=1 Tax=Clostridium lundense TaxID=319475 RepID=UPI0004896CC9|nr:hypothetical protein [Clostridium lundense]